jgi:glycoprotein endo-alpha-1,2-mannosidase
MLFIPCVGPGYDDTAVRPWNQQATRDRRQGAYYSDLFQSAAKQRPSIIAITSFNEWHEGSQIEKAKAVANVSVAPI